jgi:NAD(P)-dependent dehydrogenase (short-subunit alcohol dehydrogenase family)
MQTSLAREECHRRADSIHLKRAIGGGHDLTGEVVLITGGSRGLGKAFAQALVATGARIAITGRSASELNETAAQLSSGSNQVLAVPADVTNPEAAPQVVARVEQSLGPISILINNAGQFRAFGPIGIIDPAAWWNEVEVNLRGPFLYANAVLPGMRTLHKGKIINLASAAGIAGMPGLSSHVISKTALIRFTEVLALDTVEDGVRVFAIHPGTVRTPMNEYVKDSPEVAKSAPGLQEWFRALFAQGLDTPIDRCVQLVLRLAAGDGDTLSGRYISVEDDLDALVKQCAGEQSAEERLLRLKGVAAFYGGWRRA